MRAITVEAKSPTSAEALCAALAEFEPQLSGSDADGYKVTVNVGSSDRMVVALLNRLEQFVTERDAGPAQVELGGRGYTLHPRSFEP